ncbi:MAG: hypothetical protein PHG13_02185 [Candidatus Pacebacteria bacterium]|nr:hypothetical protein [Candidatus Paceibacterota bacterium]MDD5721789.1 hypothetical protein [Candidatus Paceibacterota bacterium]
MLKVLKNKILVKTTEWRRERSLLKVVQAEKKIIPSIEKIINKGTKPLWFSLWETTIVVVLFIFFLILTHAQTLFPYEKFIGFIEWLYPFQGSPFMLLNSNHYQNLINIHAGIGAVLIGLMFFVAQEITKERDKNNSYKRFVILKRSKFFSLLLAEVLCFFLFILGPVNILSTIPVVLIGIFTLYSLYKTFNLIIDDFELKKEEQKIFFDNLRRSFLKVLDLEITKLISVNQICNLFKNYEEYIKITPFPPRDIQNYTAIKTDKSGIFRDLDLKILKKLLAKLKEIAPVQNEMVTVDSDSSTSLSDLRTKSPLCYLSPRLFSNTKEVNNVLLWIQNDLLRNKETENEIKKLTRRAFIITQSDFDLEHARNGIRKLKLLSLDLIKDQRSDEIGEVLNNYTKLIEDFYLYLEPYGGGFSEKTARDMSMEIFLGDFNSIAWISEDIWEIFEKGIESNSKKIIKKVTYFPVRLIRYAIDYKDHLIFQQFQCYPFRLYQAYLNAQGVGKNELATLFFDRSWRYLQEISEYHLEPKLKKEEDYPEEEVRSFACAILKIFQGLLKVSFDERDIESFKTYLSTTGKLFRNLDIMNRYKSKEAEKIADFLKDKKDEMFFGLASWIFYKLSQNKDDILLKEFYNIIQISIPSRIERLTDVFSCVHNFEVKDFWGWADWEIFEKGMGQVHLIQIFEKLEKFYAVKSLSLLSEKDDKEVKKIKLPHSRNLADLIKSESNLLKTLEDITISFENWRFILNDDAINKANIFKELLIKAKKAQEQEETKYKQKQVISQQRVQEFKTEVVKAFYEDANLRDIFKKYFVIYEDKTKKKTDKKDRFGIHVVDDKALFFDDWHVHYIGWGENYGHSLASGEDSYLLDDIAKNCKEITKEKLGPILRRMEDINNIVIFATNIALWRFFEGSKNFKPKWKKSVEQLNIKGFSGWYEFNKKLIPVFETYHGKVDKQILILNKSKIGKLIQLSPLNTNEKEESIEDIFYMNIQAFSENEELMQEFIKKPPEWLKKIGDKQKQREHLSEHVRIQIFERFKYEKSKDFEGYKLIIAED